MESSCVVVPTLTTAEVGTSQSFVTTSTESISTGPSSVLTTVFRTCSQPSNTSSHCQITITTSFITFPGNTTTVTVPATLTVDVPVTVSTTLFGSSCSSISTSSSTSSTPTPTSTSTSTDPTSTTTSLSVITTLPPTAITTDSLITSDGSTFLSYYTTTDPAVTADAQSTGSPSDRRISPGPIIGGVLGGVGALLLLGLLTWYLIKKESKFGHFFRPGEDSYSSPHQIEPSYKYGMVGQQSSNPVSFSNLDPSSVFQNALGNDGGTGQAVGTASGQAVGNDGGLGQATGPAFGNDGGSGQAIGQASGQGFGNDMGSGQAIGNSQGVFGGDSGLGQAVGTSGDGGLGQTVSGGHGVVSNLPPIPQNPGNPSIIPLVAGIGTAAVASGVYATATSSRPSSSRPSSASSSQALGPLVTPAKPQGGYPPALQNWNAIHGYGQATAGPSTSSNNTNNMGDGPGPLRHGSAGSLPSVYSHSSWVGNSSTNYKSSEDSGAQGILPLMGAAVHNPHHHQQQQQQQYQQHSSNSFGRVPSLQVTNNEYNPYAESSSSMGAGPSQQAPSYDGQGRPLNMPPEKAPLVHLDGSLYQQPPRGGPRSGTEPPAYIE